MNKSACILLRQFIIFFLALLHDSFAILEVSFCQHIIHIADLFVIEGQTILLNQAAAFPLGGKYVTCHEHIEKLLTDFRLDFGDIASSPCTIFVTS